MCVFVCEGGYWVCGVWGVCVCVCVGVGVGVFGVVGCVGVCVVGVCVFCFVCVKVVTHVDKECGKWMLKFHQQFPKRDSFNVFYL